jgi:hypothetical protein
MRHAARGSFGLDVPAREAIGMFTPEGERAWAPGWDPEYAAGISESPGTVFTTQGGAETIWVVLEIDRVGCRAAYARVTPGQHAGTVRVHCADADEGNCTVSVTYDMTVLPEGDPDGLSAYEEGPFDMMMLHWADAVGSALDRARA